MEVGAVKQAFNNEVILLKKKLNQAKTQIIHKLTRKAKTLTEKKAPENLKQKLKKKAESAVNEVLILKKIKARDIAKFSITHKGELKPYLNKPQVDKDKACARLLLHKALQDKYKFIRGRFGDVPIQDLFMSRQERRKIKKEQKEQQKNKKKGTNKNIVNSEGDWDVEDMEIAEKNDASDDENDNSEADDHELNSESNSDHNEQQSDSENEIKSDDEKEIQQSNDDFKPNDSQSDDDEPNTGKFVKLKSPTNEMTITTNKKTEPINLKEKLTAEKKLIQNKIELINVEPPVSKPNQNKTNKNVKYKNKNLNEKLQTRKFKKDKTDNIEHGNKIVDPFFITATGENYLTLAEPRQPDEIKEIHKQGNRKERRAAMFGHVPKIKPRKDNPRPNFNNNYEKRNSDINIKNYKDSKNKNGTNKERFNDTKFNSKHTKFNDDNFNKSNDKKFNSVKEEKLHPSWEAKKKQSTILPFQGKKIVFDES